MDNLGFRIPCKIEFISDIDMGFKTKVKDYGVNKKVAPFGNLFYYNSNMYGVYCANFSACFLFANNPKTVEPLPDIEA